MDGVLPALADALRARGFSQLTDVQAAIRDLCDHTSDLLVSAATGSGKTVAIGLALAPALIGPKPPHHEPERRAPRPWALILVPTRELAAQVRDELAWLYAGAGIAIALCAGGTDPAAEVEALARGAALVIATPGRLRAHLRRRTFDPGDMATVVLDEADELLARGFREEIDRILAELPEGRRLLMFSATLTPGVETLARAYQRGALRIDVRRRAPAAVVYEGVAVGEGDRDRVLGNLLCLLDPERALVFRARRDAVAPLVARLARRGFPTVGLSGDLGQGERDAAIAALRAGRARVCVATDLAARGLDLPGLDLVIHADPPLSPESLVHRSGRTGRAGRGGHVILLVQSSERRRVEALMRRAGLPFVWRAEPAPGEVAARERARLIASVTAEAPGFAEAPAAFGAGENPEDAALAALAEHGADRLARALARGWFAARPSFEPAAAAPERARVAETVGETAAPVWFSVNRGGPGQGEVRRILPLICRLGGARRHEIGRVRVFERETHFEVLPSALAGFLALIGRDLGALVLRRLRPAEPCRPA